MPPRRRSNRLNNQPPLEQPDQIVPPVIVVQPIPPVDPPIHSVEFEQILAQRVAEAMPNCETI